MCARRPFCPWWYKTQSTRRILYHTHMFVMLMMECTEFLFTTIIAVANNTFFFIAALPCRRSWWESCNAMRIPELGMSRSIRLWNNLQCEVQKELLTNGFFCVNCISYVRVPLIICIQMHFSEVILGSKNFSIKIFEGTVQMSYWPHGVLRWIWRHDRNKNQP